jgi:hypothetical protein
MPPPECGKGQYGYRGFDEEEATIAQQGVASAHSRERLAAASVLGCLLSVPKLPGQARANSGETQADVARTYAVDPTTIGRLQAAG